MDGTEDLKDLLDEAVVILFDLLGFGAHQLVHIANLFLKFLNPFIWLRRCLKELDFAFEGGDCLIVLCRLESELYFCGLAFTFGLHILLRHLLEFRLEGGRLVRTEK